MTRVPRSTRSEAAIRLRDVTLRAMADEKARRERERDRWVHGSAVAITVFTAAILVGLVVFLLWIVASLPRRG